MPLSPSKHNIQTTAYDLLAERELRPVQPGGWHIPSTSAAVSSSTAELDAQEAAHAARAEVLDVERTIEESARLRRVA